MNVIEITGRWLRDAGYDGLIRYDGLCSCSASDLMRCGMSVDNFASCNPARRITCPHCGAEFYRKAAGDD